MSPKSPAVSLKEITHRKIIFVNGKGGVGRSTVSRALALALSKWGKKTLWVTFEDPHEEESSEPRKITEHLWEMNCTPQSAFEEYATLKIGVGALAKLFVRNPLMQYLSKAAPGVREVVLMGKVWFEIRNYEHVVVDMPSTGYGLAMFNSVRNYALLFKGGPISRDAEKMFASFSDPAQAGLLIVALPEEMPISEALEMAQHLSELFPENPPAFLINKLFPRVEGDLGDPDSWSTPVPSSATDYVQKRSTLEKFNLEPLGVSYDSLNLLVPPEPQEHSWLIEKLAEKLAESGTSG